VRFTQRAIKQVLTERFYSWREAEALAKNDPEIDLSGNGSIYNPSDFVEEDFVEDAEMEGAGTEQKTLLEPEVTPSQRVSPSV
jgi:large subunit ribosomal protein L47